MNLVTEKLLQEALQQVVAKPSLLSEAPAYFDEMDLRVLFKQLTTALGEYDLSLIPIEVEPKKLHFAVQTKEFEMDVSDGDDSEFAPPIQAKPSVRDITPKSSAGAKQYILQVEGDRLVIFNDKKWRVSLNSTQNIRCVFYALESIIEGGF